MASVRPAGIQVSLADLTSVLVRLDTYSSLFNGAEFDAQPQWSSTLNDSILSGVMDGEAALRLEEKSIMPLFAELLKQNAYHVACTPKTKTMIQLWKHGTALTTSIGPVVKSGAWKTLVSQPLLEHLKSSLEEVALPVLRPRGGGVPNCDASSDDWLSNELAVVEGQLADVERLLHNIFEWK